MQANRPGIEAWANVGKAAAACLRTILVMLMMTSAGGLVAGERGQAGSGRETGAGTGKVLNICEAPYFADPTGRKDCTEAILRAMDDCARKVLKAYQKGVAEVQALPATGHHRHPDSAESYRENGIAHLVSTVRLPYIRVIHFPEGTYLVSDTLRRRVGITNTYGSELNQQIRLRGAGMDRTVIRLRDHAHGFGQGTRKPVISCIRSEQTNVATSNYCEDLTINCGSGNPGAVGLDFYANNSGAVRNVRILSEDGAGFAGLQLGHSNYSGILIKHIDFNFCDLVAGADLARSNREGFIIGGEPDRAPPAPPLFVERLLAWEQWRGEHCTFTHAGKRTVCFKDIQTQTLRFYRNTVTGGKVFFDNVATTTGVAPGTNGHQRCPVSLKGQQAWARQLNPERGEPMILNDGGDLVLMGYKSEGMGIIVHTINGGRSEVLGGVVNIGRTGDTAFVAEDSEMRLSTTTHGWHSRAYYRRALRHTRDGKTIIMKAGDLPLRGFDTSRGPQYAIPLYR